MCETAHWLHDWLDFIAIQEPDPYRVAALSPVLPQHARDALSVFRRSALVCGKARNPDDQADRVMNPNPFRREKIMNDTQGMRAGAHDELRFHSLRADGMFVPVPFFFVTEFIADEILAERQRIAALAKDTPRQAALLAAYDPLHRAAIFKSILGQFQPR